MLRNPQSFSAGTSLTADAVNEVSAKKDCGLCSNQCFFVLGPPTQNTTTKTLDNPQRKHCAIRDIQFSFCSL